MPVSSSGTSDSARSIVLGVTTSLALAATSFTCWHYLQKRLRIARNGPQGDDQGQDPDAVDPAFAVLPCLRQRRSIFPKDYAKGGAPVPRRVVQSLLDAAMWAPFHGPLPPWRFVVLGKEEQRRMQERTISFYDKNWPEVGFPGSQKRPQPVTEADYEQWRKSTQAEIEGRWGPVSYMVAIVMLRQASEKKRMQEWEEAAATACAVQNMYVQTTRFPDLACYWSSWHAAFRDSAEMRELLGMGEEDKCFGFFMVASCKAGLPDKRRRKAETHMNAEWRA